VNRLQVLVAAAVIDGPLLSVTHQCFSRGSCVVTQQAKAATPPPPLSLRDFTAAPNASSPSLPLSAFDYITVTITTTSLPNQETIAHVRALLPAAPHLQVQSHVAITTTITITTVSIISAVLTDDDV
jgi:hypothetical protein